MTAAPDAPTLTFTTLEEAVAALRENGFRLSTARRLILEALFAADGPVGAPYLVDAVSIDMSSVYRNLEVLERQGLIRHVHLGHGPGLYALLGTDEVEYLYCERCAKVTSVPTDQLTPVRDVIREQFGYEARFTHFAIVGLCETCSRAADTGRDGSRRAPDSPEIHSHGGYVHSHRH